MDEDLALLAEILRTTPGVQIVLAEARALGENRKAAELLLAAVADTVCELFPDLFTPADPIRLRDFLIRMFLPPVTQRHN